MTATLAGATTLSALAVTGCRTTEDDVHAWGRKQHGPARLVAVLTHDKYATDLRVEAAMTLIGMPPRMGRRIGIKMTMDALASLPPQERATVVAALVPRLIEKMDQPVQRDEAGNPILDPTFPYKDAAFALLTSDKRLVTAPKLRTAIEEGLTAWAMNDFSVRLQARSQQYGIQQVLRALGPKSVEALPDKIEPGARSIATIAALVAELGTEETRAKAGAKLTAVANEVASQKWLDEKAPQVKEANKIAEIEPSDENFQKQLQGYQKEELTRIFTSMKKVGGKPVVEFLLVYAETPENDEQMRSTALLAMAGHLDPKNRKIIERLLALGADEKVPVAVRDIAIRRLGELPRKVVINDLFKLFKGDDWKVRALAADLALRMSEPSQVPEFMRKLGSADDGMAITEAMIYGQILGDIAPGDQAKKLATRYSSSGYPASVRLAALAYFYHSGKQADLALLKRLERDTMPVPRCDSDADDCFWRCEVGPPDKRVLKTLKTVGDFVRYCVEPAIEARPNLPQKTEDSAPKKGVEKASGQPDGKK